MDYHALDEAVTETSTRVGKIHALQDFCVYLNSIGQHKAAGLLYELKGDIIKELNERGFQTF